jgi:hypothetical protein
MAFAIVTAVRAAPSTQLRNIGSSLLQIIHKDYTTPSYNEAMTGGAVGARPAGNKQEQSGTIRN